MRGATPHQYELLRLVQRTQTESESLVDLDQILEQLSWKPSKESAQFVIRALISKGLLEKAARELRRGRTRVTFRVTEKGLGALDPTRERKVEEKPVEKVCEVAQPEPLDLELEKLVSLVPGLPDGEFSLEE